MAKSSKKTKWIKKRHKVITSILRPFFHAFYNLKYNIRIKKEKLPKEGSVILCNHTMTMDPFLVGLKFDQNLYYMASKDLFQKKFVGKLISFLVNPIPKEKSNKQDIAAVRICMKVAQENGNICIFPEGNRTFSGTLGYIDPSIVKLVKLIKKPLIICNTIGGYSCDPRWGKSRKTGKYDVFVKKTLSYEEYKDMSNDDLYNLIIENLTVDISMSNNTFKCKKSAEYLERVLYVCPICNQKHTLFSDGNYVYCKSCNEIFKYNNDSTFTCLNPKFSFKYVNDWYNWQIDLLKNSTFKDKELIFEDNIKLYEPIMFKNRKFIGEGKVSLYNNCFKFIFKDKEIVLDFDDISSITMVGKKKMNIYYKENTYQLFNDLRTNLLKYMHAFYIIKNKKVGDVDGFIGI